MDFAIGAMQRGDWAQVRAIYREGLATGLAAFMLEPPARRVGSADADLRSGVTPFRHSRRTTPWVDS